MTIQNRKGLREQANAAISASSYSPKRLALIHTGAAVALSAVLTILNYILSNQIGGTGGLSGLGLRTILSTAQMMLSIISLAVAPFWELGFLYASVRIARREDAGINHLLQGFRRFGPALRLTLLQSLLYIAIFILSTNIGSTIYLFTPFSASLGEILTASNGDLAAAQALLAENPQALIPLYCIFLLLFAVIAVPVTYRFRLAQYLIVDDPKIRALAALGTSHRLMRYNRWDMFRLDLSFWWYYALQLVCVGIAYADIAAAALGIPLPVPDAVAFFGCFFLHCISQLLVAWYFASPVAVTYATAYLTLQQMQKDAAPLLVKNFPWDFLPYQKTNE